MNPISNPSIDDDFRTQLQDYGLRYDPITGLPNQTFFRGAIRKLLAQAQAEGQQIALLWIDLTNLRREFSVGGEEASRGLVSTLADSLRPWAEEGELVCRFSDTSFLLALRRDECLNARLELILEAASHRHLRGSEGKPEISAGVAFFPEHSTNPDELIRFASLAAVSAARSRSRAAVPFTPKMNTALLMARSLEKDLRIALHEQQLSLVYQPQIDLTTGNILGVEALTRWYHPERGHVPPAQFIAVAEQSDLIDEIFAHSLQRMLMDAADWRAAGVIMPSIAVNASAANVRHDDFVHIVERELAAHPLLTTQLEVEVTESLLMDDEDLFLERLHALRLIGVKVSMDDFGTRYTGFNALKGLPLNSMKIDRCFVHGVNRSSQAQSLCRTIVTMARHLKLSTIAEGIEDVGELRAMKNIGCQAGQGYLFQRPVPSDQFLRFLREWPERKRQGQFAQAFLDVEVDPCYEVDPLFGLV
jgi:diguanylate cyclase (GGDEF)-like protein